MLPPWRRVHG